MQKEVCQGSIDTMVKIIDWTPINEIMSKAVGKSVECRIGNGYIPSVKAIFDEQMGVEETRSLILDNECCGTTSRRTNYLIGDLKDIPFSANIFKGLGFYEVDSKSEDGLQYFSMMPSFYFDIDEDDIKRCLTGEEMPLYLFMKSRYAYNPRIRGNETKTLKLIYHQDIKNGSRLWETKIKKAWDVA